MKSKYFKLYELLPPSLYKNEEEGWELIDDKLIITIDFLKELFGMDVKLIANNWKWGGNRENCCYRSIDCTVGARMSRHKDYDGDGDGEAIDLISPQISAADMRAVIDMHKDELPYPVRIEKDVTWLHIDTANKSNQKIYWFNG